MAQFRRGRFAVPMGAASGGGDLMRLQWPWRTEKRSASYTDEVVRSLVARAGGTAAADASGTAALEMASGLWGRALAAAVVSPATPATMALTPAVLQLAGRQAIRHGGSLWVIDVDDAGVVHLLPCWSWTVQGGPNPDSWVYIATVPGAILHPHHHRPGCRRRVVAVRSLAGLRLDWSRSIGCRIGQRRACRQP